MALRNAKSKKQVPAPKKVHVKKGDTVMVIAGKDKGKTGTVKRVMRTSNKVLVEGLNLVKKAVRPQPMLGVRGGLVEMEAPLQLSNVMVYDLKSNKVTRVKRVQLEEGKKRVRVSVRSNEALDD
ncbi:MAG: 50S ribosomal protein L24 [Vampirovibrionales bacterium]|nr:50S ribosomal protein L24 [Vampirovibrionales bacterium]